MSRILWFSYIIQSILAHFRPIFYFELSWKRARAELKILQLEPARLGLITSLYIYFICPTWSKNLWWYLGHTGQLSAITLFMLTLGSMARVFTSIQETGDMIVISTYLVSSTINLMLSAQVMYYWNANVHVKQE